MSSPPPTPVAAGRLLAGRYRLEVLVASGGMAQVWQGTDEVLRRKVALKLLHPHLAADAGFVARFRQEAVAAARLAHPGIVSIYDTCSDDGTEAIVMELIPGQTLRQRLDDPTPIDPWQAAGLAAQVAEALDAAHRAGLVHRDVKPSNLLIDVNGCLKVLDLGLARLSQDETSSVTVANNQQLLGTADYLAPEQALNSHSADHRADIYSLGCTLFYALTGRPPFHEGTIAQKIAQHQVAERPLVQAIRPEVPQSLGDLCRRMMDKDPAQRVASALEVATSLREIASQLAALKLKASTATSENSAVPVVDKNPFDVIGSVPLLHATESEPSFKDRRPRATRSKRPPILFWIFILVLVVVAIVLAVMVKLQHA